ncbi:MAG: redoxin family protein [Puia sp.]|nr:redoxin family protein [Puia sp.]
MKPLHLCRMACCAILLLAYKPSFSIVTDGHKTLAIGSKAPDFNLPDVNGKMYSLASFAAARILVVIFTCNHCPTAQAYEDRIMKLTSDYSGKGVAVVAIMPNDPLSLRLDEMDFSDLSDSYEDMKVRARQKNFNFPYLYDGETETASKSYGPIATPHVFIFDKDRTLRYNGRFDDQEKLTKTPTSNDARDAVEALLNNREIAVQTTKVFGCSVKWSDKRNLVAESLEKWAKEPVSVEMIDVAGLKDLMKNPSDKLRLIDLWATWCGPCTTEFPEFVSINRMYRDRDFEFISISADDPEKKDKVLKFLQKQQASNHNYLFSTDDKYKLIEAIDPAWQGALPYTLLVEPGGKIVYSKQGSIDPAELKKTIVENHLIGRYP